MAAGIIIGETERVRFVAPMNVLSNQPAFVTDAANLRQQVSKQNAQRWEITTNLEPSNSSSDFFVHSIVNGHDLPFDIEVPQVYRRAGATTAVRVSVAGSANIGSSEVLVNCIGRLVAGEFFQFDNHPKVYLVTAEREGNGALKFSPLLRAKVTPGVTLKYGNDVRMSVRYDPSVALGITYTDGIMSDPGSVKLVEAL